MPKQSTLSPDPFLGKLLMQRYRLAQLLGKGAMGRVYLAQDLQLGGVAVAVKILSHSLADDKAQVRFKREAQACAYLGQKSLHIVRVNDYGITQDGIPFYVMEYLNGPSLREILETQGPLELARFYRLARQVALGLKAAHDGLSLEGRLLQIVHRDLKPGNVMVVADDSLGELAKLVDFGIAKLLTDAGPVSVTNAYLGTFAYSSPEQLEGLSLDPRSDIYSYGIMLYQMLSGELPIIPSTDSFAGWYQAHMKALPLPLEHPACPPQVESLIFACLEKHPENRPQSIQEVLQELEMILQKPRAQTRQDTRRGHTVRLATPSPSSSPSPSWIPILLGSVISLAGLWLGGSMIFNLTDSSTDPVVSDPPVVLDPSPLEEPSPDPYAQALQSGQEALAQERYEEAILHFELALSYQPEDPVATTALEKARQAIQIPSPPPAPASTPNERDSPELIVETTPPPPVTTPKEIPSPTPLPIEPFNQPPLIQTFAIGTPQSSIRSTLGSPKDTGKGYWPNTLFDLYQISIPPQGRVDFGFIYGQNSLVLRQTEASIDDQISDELALEILESMISGSVPTHLLNGFRSVRSYTSNRYSFTHGSWKGVIERNPQGRVYLAVWEPGLHISSSVDIPPSTKPGTTLSEIRQERQNNR